MARVDEKTKPDSLKLTVGKKPPKGKSPIKISKPKTLKVPTNGVSPDKAAIQAAFAGEEINTKAVEEAKKALADGTLDTPEGIKRAAEKMLDSGL